MSKRVVSDAIKRALVCGSCAYRRYEFVVKFSSFHCLKVQQKLSISAIRTDHDEQFFFLKFETNLIQMDIYVILE
jgi:hypothetical protein